MAALSFSDICACLVTRGDVDLGPILETLPYGEVVIWDNSEREDLKVYGRYEAITLTERPVIYFQDDDTIFRDHDELLANYEPGLIISTYGHGENPDGYDDLPLVCGGALVDRELPTMAFARYLSRFARDEGFLYEADFIFGVLTPFRNIASGFEIRDVAYNGKRLADEPWQRDLKKIITDRARSVRDEKTVAA